MFEPFAIRDGDPPTLVLDQPRRLQRSGVAIVATSRTKSFRVSGTVRFRAQMERLA
jgi:hypothetical protein